MTALRELYDEMTERLGDLAERLEAEQVMPPPPEPYACVLVECDGAIYTPGHQVTLRSGPSGSYLNALGGSMDCLPFAPGMTIIHTDLEGGRVSRVKVAALHELDRRVGWLKIADGVHSVEGITG